MSDWYDISSYLPWTGYRGNYGGWVNDQLVEYLGLESIVDGFSTTLNENGEYFECFISASGSAVIGAAAGVQMKIERASDIAEIYDLTWEIHGAVTFTIQPGAKILVEIGAEIKALLQLAPKVTIRLNSKKEMIQALAIMTRLILAGTMPVNGGPSWLSPVTNLAQQILIEHTWDDIDWIRRKISKVKYEITGSISAEVVAEAEVTDNWSLVSNHIGGDVSLVNSIELQIESNRWDLENTVEVKGKFAVSSNLLGWGAGGSLEQTFSVGHRKRILDTKSSNSIWSLLLDLRNQTETLSKAIWEIIKFSDNNLSAGYSVGTELGISESNLNKQAAHIKISSNVTQLIGALNLLLSNAGETGIQNMLNSLSTTFPASAVLEIQEDSQHLSGWVLDEEIKVVGIGFGVRFGARTCTHQPGFPKKVDVRPSDIVAWITTD